MRIAGADPLELVSDDVAPEGAATSFQVHLRVDPADFTRTYNAVQAATEADRLLGVIAARVATGQTGAVWQRRTLATLEPRLGRERALAAMLERYLEYGAGDQPVHSWPTGR